MVVLGGHSGLAPVKVSATCSLGPLLGALHDSLVLQGQAKPPAALLSEISPLSSLLFAASVTWPGPGQHQSLTPAAPAPASRVCISSMWGPLPPTKSKPTRPPSCSLSAPAHLQHRPTPRAASSSSLCQVRATHFQRAGSESSCPGQWPEGDLACRPGPLRGRGGHEVFTGPI